MTEGDFMHTAEAMPLMLSATLGAKLSDGSVSHQYPAEQGLGFSALSLGSASTTPAPSVSAPEASAPTALGSAAGGGRGGGSEQPPEARRCELDPSLKAPGFKL